MMTLVILLGCASVAAIVTGLDLALSEGDPVGLVVGLCALAVALSAWRFGLYPRVTATNDGLTVRNPLRTTFLPWTEVLHVSPGYSGLEIDRPNGTTVTAWAVQEANISDWLGRQTRSKAIAAELMELARR